MKFKPLVLLWVLCALTSLSCRDRAADEKGITGSPAVGALYSLNDGEGGYRLAQVIAAEDNVIFVRLFADRWSKRPSLAEARQAADPMPVAYRPDSFTGMTPVHLENGAVAPQDAELFAEWKNGKQEIF